MSDPICTMSCSNATGWDYDRRRTMCKCDGVWHDEGTDCKYRVKDDLVNHPSHYTAGKVECIDAIESAVTGLDGVEAVLTGQAIKYMWRWSKKNGVQDLEKAEWYLKRLIGLERTKQTQSGR